MGHEITNITSRENKTIKVKLCMIKEICQLEPQLICSKDLIGNTFFHKAMFLNQDICISVLKIFIKAGGLNGIYTENRYKQTILHTACQKKKTSVKVIKFLVEQAKFENFIDETDDFNLTPRRYALNNKLESIVSYFESYNKKQSFSPNNLVNIDEQKSN